MPEHEAISQTAARFCAFVKQDGRWKDVSRIPRDTLRDFYTNEYKPEYKKTHPGGNVANFAVVFLELKKRRLIEMNGQKEVKIRAAKHTVAQKIAESAALQTDLSSSDSQTSPVHANHGRSRRRRERPRHRSRATPRAVDQFLTMPSGEPLQGDSDSDSKEVFVERTKSGFSCILCKAYAMTGPSLDQHLKGKKHRLQKLLRTLKGNGLKYIAHPNVSVTSDFDCNGDSIRLDMQPGKTQSIVITIKNTSPDERLILMGYELIKKNKTFTFSDDKRVCDLNTSVHLEPDETYGIRMTASPTHINHYHACVVFIFKSEQDESMIHIMRYICAISTTPQVVKDFGPTEPYRRAPRVTLYQPLSNVVEGYPLPSERTTRLEEEEPLPRFSVSKVTRMLVNNGLKDSNKYDPEACEKLLHIRDVLATDLCPSSHAEKFSELLFLEEIQMDVDIRQYDMSAVIMEPVKHDRKLVSLKVPGLAENRPSVLKGDHLFAEITGQRDGRSYKGYVHRVEMDHLHLGFGDKLMGKFLPGMRFDVRFTFSRASMRLQHRAVQLAEEHSLEDVLFPSPGKAGSRGTIQPVNTTLRFFDKKLEDNAQQAAAVRHIVSGTSRPAPYVLFGPPGTGKTVTMVEAIKQVLRCIPNVHVLACAPSNSAADQLCQRLVPHIEASEVFRMNAFSRDLLGVPKDILPSCNYKNGNIYLPPKRDLQKYKVVVTTLVTAGRIASANFPPGHFSHVFLDECGQATEPETLIALAGILESDINSPDGGQIVLAGDPEQLGPVLRSPVAIKHGLATSMLERLMKACDVYARNEEMQAFDEDGDFINFPPYDECCVTKLLKNYRSHPTILDVPNKAFYHGELEVHADKMERESLCNWEGLPTKGFPILFHGVVGKDQREGNSPSFFNPEECALVMDYIQKLLDAKGILKLKPKQIGVISPYRKQVQKLQKAIKKKGYADLKVGSVEEFQGQERLVIIISTVRSSEEFLPIDSRYKLGFLKNPKRFNVAVTRAKALLIVIGNPFLIRMDPHWNQQLQYVMRNKGYTGVEMQEEEEEVLDIMERLAAVKLDHVDTEEMGVSAVTAQEDPEWRGDDV